MEVNGNDYVYRYPDSEEWEVKITIPNLNGLVEVVIKDNLTTEEMNSYEFEEFDHLGHALINFYVETTKPPLTPVIRFQPKMTLEARGGGEILVYLDFCKGIWREFRHQGKEGDIYWAKIKDWAADPPVAWGFR